MSLVDRLFKCAGPVRIPVFLLHPLGRCNLSCRHCYLTSSSQSGEFIPLSLGQEDIDIAAYWGYEILAISGGEPALYKEVDNLVERAKAHGMKTSMVTYGIFIRRKDICRRCAR
jgi:Fe-coproporphyrin III synthase